MCSVLRGKCTTPRAAGVVVDNDVSFYLTFNKAHCGSNQNLGRAAGVRVEVGWFTGGILNVSALIRSLALLASSHPFPRAVPTLLLH